MNQEEAFVRAIVDSPEDETLRLVYADWLEENGQVDRAGFIRTQVTLDRACRDVPMLDDWHWSTFRQVLIDGADDWGRTWVDYTDAQRELARMVEDKPTDFLSDETEANKLLDANRQRWTRPLKGLVEEPGFRRGLLERIRTTPATIESDAEELFRAAPILDVTLEECGEDLEGALQRLELAQITTLHIAGCEVGWTKEGLVGQALAKAKHLTRLRSLWLERCVVGDKGLKHLAGSPHLAGLRELHLEGNHFTPKGIRALTTSPYLTQLERLYLNGAWHIGPSGAKLLAKWPGLAGVTTLDLSSCGIKDTGLAALAASPHLARLRWLYLQANAIEPKGVRALAVSPGLPRLRFLELSNNKVQQEALLALLQSDLAANLSYLGLGGCWVCGDGAEALAGSPSLERLCALDLSGNSVCGEGLAALFSSPHLRLLGWLDLSANDLCPEALELLPKENSLGCLWLLFLNHNDLGDAGIMALAQWPGMKNVAVLHLEETGMGNAGAEALASSPNLDSLTGLNARFNSIGRKGKQALRGRFMKELVQV